MAANFFEQQAQARTATKRLVLLYIMAVMSIITAITFVFHMIFLVSSAHSSAKYGGAIVPESTPWSYDLVVAFLVLCVIAISTAIRMIQVGSSGESVALMLGGIPVSPATTDLLERRLMNVVEEMSIASGMPVPRVFVMRDEDGINAFAAGMRPGQAVIAVTRGTLEQLTRDELQGVIAHEFSHIFNGDMRLNIRLMGVLGGILVIATVGRLLFQVTPSRVSSSDRKNDGNGLIIFGIALFVIGYIGVFFARLIKAAVSRQREYLADASAVQFTRNPEGIGGALMKIRGFAPSSTIHSHYAEEASHMFFGSALNFSSVFATHPPLEDRIARVDAALLKNGAWIPKPALSATEAEAAGVNVGAAPASYTGGARSPEEFLASAPAVSALSETPVPSNSKSVLASIGAPSANDMDAARSFLNSIPASIRERTREGQGAVLLVVALFIENHEIQDDQMRILSSSLSPEEVQEVVSIQRELAEIGELDRLSLLELAIPPLRQLTAESKKMLMKIGTELVHADNELDLYEYVALALLEHQLLRDLRARKPKPSISSQRTANDLATLLSAIAYAGADDIPTAKIAFDTGVASLRRSMDIDVTFRPLDECKLQEIADSIERLSCLNPDSQRTVIQACVEAILVDGVVNTKESELLRGLCAVLEAPLPALAV